MMSKGLILYQSKYGATKKYVDWIVQQTGFDFIETAKADIKKAAGYETIILAGGIYASGIAGLSFLKKNAEQLKNKKIAVLCVGASPYEEKAFAQIYEHNFKGSLQGIPCFYGRGAWDEGKMSFKDRTLCKMLQKAVAKQDPAAYEPWQKALLCSAGQTCDWTDRQYLQPLFDWINS
jgi:menaquinone-dependent protoporphyrinogen IX oxidase